MSGADVGGIADVLCHRYKYMMSPQVDLYRNILRYVRPRARDRGLSVVDYGCGTGIGTVMLYQPGWVVYGVDRDARAVSLATDLWGHLAQFAQEDWTAKRSPWDSRALDVIVAIEVVEHVEAVETLLAEFRRVLRPDGLLFCSTLNHNSQYRKNPGHVGRFRVPDFRAAMCDRFPGCAVLDYTLTQPLDDDSTVTPMVAVWGRTESEEAG